MMMKLAEQIVDALLEGWFADRWNDVKVATGIGHDSFGMGRNTQRGWKPNYKPGAKKSGDTTFIKRPVKPHPRASGERTWELS